jgi:hypothetical protein
MVTDVLTPTLFIKGVVGVVASGVLGLSATIFTVGSWTNEQELKVAANTDDIEEISEQADEDHESLIRLEERQKVILDELGDQDDKLDAILNELRAEN